MQMHEKPLTKKRPMKSFEADPDVQRMLDRAEKEGIRLVWICNNALRRFLAEKGYARKKDISQ